MRIVAVQQVTKEMEDGKLFSAVKTVVRVVNPKLHVGHTLSGLLNYREIINLPLVMSSQ